ncbi:MAG: acyl-CoA dehydrogenase family protein [Hyphomicrobiaceae bacterium]
MDSTSLIADTASRILRDHCDPQTLNSATGDGWQAPAWAALEDAGLPLAWVPEELGGAGVSVQDGFDVLRVAGRYAVPLPIAETLLAGWLLSQSGIAVPRGAMTCAPTRPGDNVILTAAGALSGRVRGVPFAKTAKHLALVAQREDGGGQAIALLDCGSLRVADGSSIAGDALNTVHLQQVRPIASKDASLDAQALLTMGAAVRAVQMSGALEAILEIAVAYANERVAFERPIAKFQAVQHNLARLAGEVAAAMAAAGSAADAIASTAGTCAGGFDDAVLLEVAAAKIRVGEAAGEGAGIAHQVLGAIGFTREHVLHRFTQRLWAWRDDFDNESAWAVRLGALVAAGGGEGLWPLLASR